MLSTLLSLTATTCLSSLQPFASSQPRAGCVLPPIFWVVLPDSGFCCLSTPVGWVCSQLLHRHENMFFLTHNHTATKSTTCSPPLRRYSASALSSCGTVPWSSKIFLAAGSGAGLDLKPEPRARCLGLRTWTMWPPLRYPSQRTKGKSSIKSRKEKWETKSEQVKSNKYLPVFSAEEGLVPGQPPGTPV